MQDYIELGPCPTDIEPDMSNGVNGRYSELLRYKQLLKAMFPDYEKHDCSFGIKSFPHDFGSYREVVIYFDRENDDSSSFALHVYDNLPDTWESTATLSAFINTGNMDHLKGYRYPDDPAFF